MSAWQHEHSTICVIPEYILTLLEVNVMHKALCYSYDILLY